MSDSYDELVARIDCNHPDLDHLSDKEAETYIHAFDAAERVCMLIWSLQNDRMTDGRVDERLERTERNTLLELMQGLTEDILKLNTFEDTGRVAKTRDDMLRDERKAMQLVLFDEADEPDWEEIFELTNKVEEASDN